ncbi:MAG: hypothetical protein ACRETQ_10645 [Gammaproteobacteria bacterium]
MASKYIEALRLDSGRKANDKNMESGLRSFLMEFHRGLNDALPKDSKTGLANKHIIPKVITKALQHLLGLENSPSRERFFEVECRLKKYLKNSALKDKLLCELIGNKRIDMVIHGPKTDLLIEFKSLGDFNSFGAAMAEMQIVKKFTDKKRRLITSVMFLYPQQKSWNAEGFKRFKALDKELHGEPSCDQIWCLATGENERTTFDVVQIAAFREFVLKNILN